MNCHIKFILLLLIVFFSFTKASYAGIVPCCPSGYQPDQATNLCTHSPETTMFPPQPIACTNNYACNFVIGMCECNSVNCVGRPVTEEPTQTSSLFGFLRDLKTHDPLNNNRGIIKQDMKIGGVLSALLPYIFAFAGIILFVMFIMSGFALLTAMGNKEKMAKGSAMMTSALIGFVVIFIAYWIMQLLELILGINLGFSGGA